MYKKWMLVVGVAILGAAGAAGLAQAFSNNLVAHLKAGGEQYCLDASLVQRQREGDPVHIYKCHGHENQRWTITHDTNDQSAIVGLDGYCLDVRGSGATASGTPAQLWKCHYGKNQLFRISPIGQIIEVESGKCLLAPQLGDGAPVVLNPCANNDYEKWNFIP